MKITFEKNSSDSFRNHHLVIQDNPDLAKLCQVLLFLPNDTHRAEASVHRRVAR